jgi:hypothetical protein
MRDYRPGDFIYNNGNVVGVVLRTEDIKREFASYRVIAYTKTLELWYDKVIQLGGNVPEYYDIYRLSDGPQMWLGSFSHPDNAVDNVWLPFHFEYPQDRLDLMMQDYPLHEEGAGYDFLLNMFINISEKELEEHFNQVFASS